MFEINPNVLYSKRDLVEALAGTCDVDRLLARIRPRAVIQGVFLGRHLLDALATAPDYRDAEKLKSQTRRRPRSATRPAEKIGRIRKEEIFPLNSR